MFRQEEVATMDAKILYVDDDPQNGSLMKRILEANGYNVSLASDGLTGLMQASLESPDLILLDVNMPDLNGYQVAQSLRQMERTKNIPILFVSATPDLKHEYRRVGGNGYITKPIDVDQISEQVAAYLRV
jgi:CheY-like chemotaxis protein